ncbi:PLP-dependent aminotransferase family protein [Streptomyces lunalinharesii]|uniref:aminotransferase-like domain-containing protein n=1 Tax=Streptomyces lunalinharesii TaxID=333384 RepID=UPI0031D69139
MESLTARLGRWSAGRGPLYLLLAGRLRQMIEDGLLRPGAPLPADRALAAALAVGRSTVVAAYETLRQEGRITRRQGSGTRVADAALAPVGDTPEEAAGPARAHDTSNPLFLHLLEPADGVIMLSCAAPAGPPPQLVDAYRTLTFPSDGDLGYHPAGFPALREAIAARFTARGVPTGPEQVLVTTGAQQALSLLTRHLVSPGDRVLVEAPTYAGALDVFREAAGVPLAVPSGVDGIDVTAAERAMAAERPALGYVISCFHNPTGGVLPPLAGRRLVTAARRHGVPLIDDEVLAELPLSAPAPQPLAAFGDVISIGSLSKLLWGGLRIGWVRGDAGLVSRLSRLKALHDLGTDVPTQLAAVRLLAGLDELLAPRRARLRACHDHLRAELERLLPSWHCPPVPGGQTLWARLPHGDGVSFAQLGLRHGVAVLPGAALDPTGRSHAHLRLHFLHEPEVLTQAVERLAHAWHAYQDAPPRPRTGTALNAITV